MALRTVSILNEPKYFQKFCVFENKALGCKDAYGCRIACPLWRAQQVEWLMNNKGMTLGEAHKATLRVELSSDERKEALRAMIKETKSVSIATLLDVIESNDEKRSKKE